MDVITLYRPVGPEELALIERAEWRLSETMKILHDAERYRRWRQ